MLMEEDILAADPEYDWTEGWTVITPDWVANLRKVAYMKGYSNVLFDVFEWDYLEEGLETYDDSVVHITNLYFVSKVYPYKGSGQPVRNKYLIIYFLQTREEHELSLEPSPARFYSKEIITNKPLSNLVLKMLRVKVTKRQGQTSGPPE